MLPKNYRVLKSETPDLTTRQRGILSYILLQWSRGCPPTNRMIGFNFDISSPNGVLCHIRALQKKGYVQQDRFGMACTAPTPKAIALAFAQLAKWVEGQREERAARSEEREQATAI